MRSISIRAQFTTQVVLILMTVLAISFARPAAFVQTAPAPLPALQAGYPPLRGIPADDTTTKRLAAVRRDLASALGNLSNAPKDIHGGFVEKATSDINQALDYVAGNRGLTTATC